MLQKRQVLTGDRVTLALGFKYVIRAEPLLVRAFQCTSKELLPPPDDNTPLRKNDWPEIEVVVVWEFWASDWRRELVLA